MKPWGRKIVSAAVVLLLMVIAELVILGSLLENPTEISHRPFFWLIGIIMVIAVMPVTTLRKKCVWLPVIMVFSIIITDQTTWGGIWEMIVEDNLADEVFFRKPSNAKTVNVKSDKWSDWITVWAGKKLVWEIPGKHIDIQFTDGRIITVAADKMFDGFGEYSSKFRLRGVSGKVRITTIIPENAGNCFYWYTFSDFKVITVPIRSNKWSDWVEIDYKDYLPEAGWSWSAPGAITFDFHWRERVAVPNGARWNPPVLPGRKFRVKGDPGTLRMTFRTRYTPKYQTLVVQTQPAEYSRLITEADLPYGTRINIDHRGWLELYFPEKEEKIRIENDDTVVHIKSNGSRNILAEFPSELPSARFKLKGTDGNTVIALF